MDRPWFDQETGTLLLDEYVLEMNSYQRIVEDEAITDEELVEQTQRVASLLRQLEETLSPEAKVIATEALGELAVLNALQVKRLQAASMLLHLSIKQKTAYEMGTFSSTKTVPYV